MLVEIREERPGDVAAIRDLNKRAFGQDQEGNIVNALRSNGAVLLSLVATLNGRVVGHIMYSPLSVGGEVTGRLWALWQCFRNANAKASAANWSERETRNSRTLVAHSSSF